MLTEIEKHKTKLQTLTGLEPADLNEIIRSITCRIHLVNEEFISKANILAAETIVKDVDFNDLLFVGLTLELKGRLWTGDKKLIQGIVAKGFKNIITTSELSEILDNIGRKT